MSENDNGMIVPAAWQELPVEQWRSPIVIVGSTDSGKTTFGRYLYRRLLDRGDRVAFIDLDPGQNVFGLPTTATLGLSSPPAAGPCPQPAFPPPAPGTPGLRRHVFIGSNTPVGHEPRVLAALHRLAGMAQTEGASRVIVDTSGFVDVAHGAAELKWAKVDMLRPCTVVALRRQTELAPITGPWRRCEDVELVVLPVSEHVRARSREARRAYRTGCYRRYFANAGRMPLHWRDLALYATDPWSLHQLLALEDATGCVLALAMVAGISEAVVWLTTPWSGPRDTGLAKEVAAIRMGTIRLDPVTFEDTTQGPIHD